MVEVFVSSLGHLLVYELDLLVPVLAVFQVLVVWYLKKHCVFSVVFDDWVANGFVR